MNADCTGSIATAAHPLTGLAFQADIVIVNDGATVLFIGTMPELVFRGIAKRLFDLLR